MTRAEAAETVADLLLAREHDTATSLLFEDRRVSWAEHVRISRHWAACIDEMLDGALPRHVGVLLANVPEYSYLLGAAALGGGRGFDSLPSSFGTMSFTLAVRSMSLSVFAPCPTT